ncbi:MAG: ribonuclease R [Myxococcota bacterium]
MTKLNPAAVTAALRERAPRPMHVSEIARRLQLAKRKRPELGALLEAMVADGRVEELEGRRYRAAGRSAPTRPPLMARIERGYLTMNARGFGFVAVESGGDDVFIPPDSLGAAMHGDRVEVEARPSRKGREGRIVTVLERGRKRFAAVIERNGKKGRPWLEPEDPRLPSPIALVHDCDEPSGLAVVAEFVEYPQGDDSRATAQIVELLGVQGMTAVEVAKIKIKEGVVETFDDAALSEAARLPDRVPESDFEGREDLRHLDLVTIDPADARDHDDALVCEQTSKGFRLVVAIADVAHYVRENTAIDEAARQRMTSIYLPDRAIPMLPKAISSGLASLVPDEDRLCMAVELELTKNGRVRGQRLMEGVMRSRARITYEGAARALGLTEVGPLEEEAEKRKKGLAALYALSKVLRARRMERGALDFDLPEPKVVLDRHQVEPIDVRQSRKDEGVREAYRLVEEMMLIANETVARFFKERNVPTIHRIHGTPDDQKIERFAKLARALGYSIDAEAAKEPKELSKFLRAVEGTEQAPVLRYLLLRAMQQAAYDTDEDVGHFGLAARDYLHFTSPIRRYPDLEVHRTLKRILRREPIDRATATPRLRRTAADASRLERRAITVERQVVDLYRAILLRDRVGDEFDCTVSGVSDRGFYVRFDKPYCEAHVPLDRLDDDYYELGELGIRLIGTRNGRIFALGDRLRVRLESVVVGNREVIALPIETLAQTEVRSGGRGAPRRKRRRDDSNPRKRPKGKEPKGRGRKGAGERKSAGGRTKKGKGRAKVSAISHRGLRSKKR